MSATLTHAVLNINTESVFFVEQKSDEIRSENCATNSVAPLLSRLHVGCRSVGPSVVRVSGLCGLSKFCRWSFCRTIGCRTSAGCRLRSSVVRLSDYCMLSLCIIIGCFGCQTSVGCRSVGSVI